MFESTYLDAVILMRNSVMVIENVYLDDIVTFLSDFQTETNSDTKLQAYQIISKQCCF